MPLTITIIEAIANAKHRKVEIIAREQVTYSSDTQFNFAGLKLNIMLTRRCSMLIGVTVVVACIDRSWAQITTNSEGCVTDYNASAGVDYFPEKAVIEYAQTFSVEYFDSYKVLTTSDAKYVLYQCGTTKPDLEEDVQEYISIPVTNVAIGTPDHIPRIAVGTVRGCQR